MGLAKSLGLLLITPALLISMACTQRTANDASYKDQVQKSLEQAELKDVTVSEDRDKNTITLGGKVHSEDAKNEAGRVAQANAGNRIIANEISVQPVGAESQAKDVASNLDDGIEKNYKAALIEKGLDKEHIRFSAKNGVLTLKGSVKNASMKQEAQRVAKSTPNVQQVVNQVEVKR